MNLDLNDDVENDIGLVVHSFLDVGWVSFSDIVSKTIEANPDLFKRKILIEKRLRGIKLYHDENKMPLTISFETKLLSYVEDNRYHGKIRSVLWIKCCIKANERWMLERQMQYLKEETFPKLSIKPFVDLHAIKNHFSEIINISNRFQTSFYLNPDYSNGCRADQVIYK